MFSVYGMGKRLGMVARYWSTLAGTFFVQRLFVVGLHLRSADLWRAARSTPCPNFVWLWLICIAPMPPSCIRCILQLMGRVILWKYLSESLPFGNPPPQCQHEIQTPCLACKRRAPTPHLHWNCYAPPQSPLPSTPAKAALGHCLPHYPMLSSW